MCMAWEPDRRPNFFCPFAVTYITEIMLNVTFEWSLLVFYVTRNDISVIYMFVTAQMCRRTEEVVPTVGLPTQ